MDSYVPSFWRSRNAFSCLLSPILSFFSSVGFSCGKQANDRFTFSNAVTNDEDPQLEAHSQQNETVFVRRMIGVEELYRLLIIKSAPGFLKGNTVLLDVAPVLRLIPVKRQLMHQYIVCMS